MRYTIILFLAIVLVGCSNQENSNPEYEGGEDSSVSVEFRNLDVQAEDNQFYLIGEVNSSVNEIYFTVEQEGEVLAEEKSITLDEGNLIWREFELQGPLPDGALEKEEAPIIRLYVKDADGEEVNPNYFPVDLR